MKHILLFLFAGLMLCLSSCASFDRAMGHVDRAIGNYELGMQVADAYERQYRYIKAQMPYQRSANGTRIHYNYNHSIVLDLEWEDTWIKNKGRHIEIYKLRRGKYRLFERIPKGYHASYEPFMVKARDPRRGIAEYFDVQIVTIPGNVYVYLKRGNARLESYSMR